VRDPIIKLIEDSHALSGYGYDKRALAVFASVMELSIAAGLALIVAGAALGEGAASFAGEALSIVSTAAVAGSALYPQYLIRARRSHFNDRFVYTLLKLSPLIWAGIPIGEAIREVHGEEDDPVIRRELALILRDMGNGVDPITALKRSAERVPSYTYRDAINVLVEGSRLTPRVGELLLSKSNSLLADKLTRLSRVASDLGVLFEVYTLAVMLFPLLLIVLSMSFSILGSTAIGPVPINTAGLMLFMTIIYVPLASVIFYMIFDMYESTL